MSIRRAARPTERFTRIHNDVLQDKRLSMRALGMLVRLLSRPDNWVTNSETLAREFDCGRDAVRATLRELAVVGYVYLKKTREPNGQINSEWLVNDEPMAPAPGNPYPGEPAPENPASGESGPLQTTDLQTTDTNPVVPKKEKKPRAKRESLPTVSLKTWLETTKAKGEQAIPADHGVFAYATKVGIPEEFMQLAWRVFKARYSKENARRYKAWRTVFQKAIEENWLKLWWIDPKTGFGLTTAGIQAQREHAAEDKVVA